MFGIDSGELLVIAIVALVVIGPKDLPRVMGALGNFVGKARGMARHFRSGVDAMIRESELADMEKKWQADNERIMREHPSPAPAPGPVPAETEIGEAWPEPIAEPPKAKALKVARPRGDRPKAPPRGAATARPAAAAPPIPAQAPTAPPAGGEKG
jgi:sec-independent protein translocase protein TatB